MVLEVLRSVVTRRPAYVVCFWLAVTVAVGTIAPDLTRIAAEGQAGLLHPTPRAVARRRPWHVPGPISPANPWLSSRFIAWRASPARIASSPIGWCAWETVGRPAEVLRVLGPKGPPEVAERLASGDGTVQLIAVPLAGSYVAPATHRAVGWVEAQAREPRLAVPGGLEIFWTGNAVLGRDYMANVQVSLDRAALATVFLLLVVLLAVYRSIWLALVPLTTIGASLVISRSARVDGPRRLGDFSAGGTLPRCTLVRDGDGFLPVRLVALRRALQRR